MKKKLFGILTIFCLILPMAFGLAGCNSKQITMVQIRQALDYEHEQGWLPSVEGMNITEFDKVTTHYQSISAELLSWQIKFENQNVNTEKLMSLNFYYYSGKKLDLAPGKVDYTYRYYIYVFKFSDKDSAKNCYKKYDFESQNYTAKQYGNLIVACAKELGTKIYEFIDKI